MRLPPIEVLQSWPNPNYNNPVTRGNALLIVNCIFITLVIITVGLRLYTRIWIKRWFGMDDVFILLALLFTLGLTALVLLANQQYGWNRHLWDIPFTQFEPTLKTAMAAKIIFTSAATFTRLSLLTFYYRLVADTGMKWFRWLIHANVVYSVGILISYIFIAIFMCIPVRYYWTVGAPEGHCIDEAVATLICGIINCVADLATTLTPLPMVLQLKMPPRQRFAVAILFSLGFVVTIAGIVRTWFIYRSLFNEYDQTWYAYPLWIAAAVEIDLGVICASAPVLRPLLQKIPFNFTESFSRSFSSKKSSQKTLKGSAQLTPASARKASGAPSAFSKRKSETITSVPELSSDRGKSYELKHWEDLETGVSNDKTERGSQEAILGDSEQGQHGKGIRGMWDKVVSSEDKSRTMDNMTIMRTDEVELHISEIQSRDQKASARTSFSRKTSG